MRVSQPQTHSPDQPGKYGDYLSLLRPQEVVKALSAVPGRKADKIFPTSTGSLNRRTGSPPFCNLLFQPTSTNVFSGFLKTGFFFNLFSSFESSEQFLQRLAPYQTQDISKMDGFCQSPRIVKARPAPDPTALLRSLWPRPRNQE